MKVKNYKDLIVWQKSIELVVEVYSITSQFPKEEKFGLSSQVQRSAVGIPSNIAEGAGRNHTKEFENFLGISFGCSTELETQLIIAKRIYKDIDYELAESLNTEIQKMLSGLMKSLNPSNH